MDEAAVVSKAKFIEDLGADSLDIVELVMAMEEAFGVDIPDEEAENIRTVEDAVGYIQDSRAQPSFSCFNCTQTDSLALEETDCGI